MSLADSVVVAEDTGRPETQVSCVAGIVEVQGELVENTSNREALNIRDEAILETLDFDRDLFVVGIGSAGSADLAREVVQVAPAVCRSDNQDSRLREYGKGSERCANCHSRVTNEHSVLDHSLPPVVAEAVVGHLCLRPFAARHTLHLASVVKAVALALDAVQSQAFALEAAAAGLALLLAAVVVVD